MLKPSINKYVLAHNPKVLLAVLDRVIAVHAAALFL